MYRIWLHFLKHKTLFIPHATKLEGYIGFTLSVCLSVCPSVCLSVKLSCPPCSIYSSGWILSIFGAMINSMRKCVAWFDPLHWPVSSRSFGLDWENRVRSVTSTVLDGLFLYLAQMITIIRGCVTFYVFVRIWKFEILENIRPRPWKKNPQFSMDSFHI